MPIVPRVFLTFICILFSAIAWAQTPSWNFTFEGYVEEAGSPIDDTKNFRFQLIGVSGSQRCVLYDETQDVKVEKGNFAARIGAGTRGGDDPGLTFKQIYGLQPLTLSSVKNENGSACTGFDSVTGQRYVRVFVGSEKVGDVLMTRAPMATQAAQAADSDKVGGKAVADLVQIDAVKNVTQNHVVDVFDTLYLVPAGMSARWNSSTQKFEAYDFSNGAGLTDASVSWSKLKDIPAPLSDLGAAAIAGCVDGKVLKRVAGAWACADDAAGSFGGVSSANSYLTVTNGSTAPALTLNVGTAANTVAAGNDSRFENAKKIQGADVDTTGLTSGQVLKYDGTKWAPANDNTGSTVATDLLSLTSTGIVQRNGANSFSTVTVVGPLSYASGTLGLTVGTANGSVAAGDDARFGNATKIQNVNVDTAGLSSGQVLKYDGSKWAPANDQGITAETDSSVSTWAKTSPGTGLTVSSGKIVPDFGTGTGKVAAGDDSRFPSSTCVSGNYSRWDGSTWSCDPASATDSTKLPTAGGTMTGDISMGTNKILFGGSVDQIHLRNTGNVAVTLNSPTSNQAMLNFMTSGTATQSISQASPTGTGWQFYSNGSGSSSNASQFGLSYWNGGGWYNAFKINPSVNASTGGEIGLYTSNTERLRIQNDGTVSVSNNLSTGANVDSSGRFASTPKTNGDALSAITANFSNANTIRSTISTAANCGTLNVTNTTPGAYHTITLASANTTCTIQRNGLTANIKLPSGYSSGVAVNGVIYTFLDDGATLWVSYVPF